MVKIKILFFVLSFLYCYTTMAQTATINGKLVDSVGKQNLENASVSLLDSKDSTLEQFTVAKSSGFFELKNVPLGSYILQINFQSFAVVQRKLNITTNNLFVQLGNIYLQQKATTLDSVTVTTQPIVIKNDTIQYNAGSFKTKPNATAEDLLKKMPGIQVDKDGNVKAAGEDVQRVLVDGKRFFGDDPKMATKNLPSDVIDKIQVFDAASDQSAFTGFDDGNKTKTINIVTKKDKRKGSFGKGSVGFGSDGEQLLNDDNISLSNFNNGRQLTLTATANNVNKQNFSVQDVLGSLGSSSAFKGMGGRGMSGVTNMIQNLIGSGMGNGLVNTASAGLNYSNNFKWDELNTSGFYNNQRTNKTTTSFTENLVGNNRDSSIFTTQKQTSYTNNKNGRFNVNFEKQFDSLGNNAFILRPSVQLQQTEKSNVSENYSAQAKTINLNNSNTNNGSSNNGYNANIDFTFKHRFATKGRTISLNTTISRNDNDGNGINNSITNFYDTATHSYISNSRKINQLFNTFNSTKSYGATVSYTEPIAKNSLLEIAVNHNYQQAVSDKETLDYDSLKQSYANIVTNLSNNFLNTYKSDRATVSYRIKKEKYNISIGNGVQWGNLKSVNRSTQNVIEQNYTNFYPTLNFNYSFNKTQNLRFNYNGRTQQPSVTQLQPVLDNSDPLNIRLGNADLQQKFTHTARAFYTSFNIFTQKMFITTINASVTTNDIQQSVYVFKNGAKVTQPVNLNGTYNIIGFVNYGFPIRSPKSNFNIGLNFTTMQSQSLLNNESNYNRNTTIGTNLIWTTNLKEKWDVNFTSNSMFNLARYTLQPNQNADYFSQYLSTEITYYTKTGWSFASDFDYTYNSGRSSNYNTSVPLLNASISKQILKNKAGEIKLYAFDLLHQNNAITRDVSSTYIQDVQTNVLSTYFMLSFSYNLRKFKGSGMQGTMPSMNKIFRGKF